MRSDFPRRVAQALTSDQFDVLRREGTEPPFSSPLNGEKRRGLYRCAGCELALFTSEAKFDSGTGWPSFTAALADAVSTRTDYKLVFPRTEYHCARCGGHQGHVFNDGPGRPGKRYCNNGCRTEFEPQEPDHVPDRLLRGCLALAFAAGARRPRPSHDTAAEVHGGPRVAVGTFAGGCFWCMEPPSTSWME